MLPRKTLSVYLCVSSQFVSYNQINCVGSELLMLQMKGQMESNRSVSSSTVSV